MNARITALGLSLLAAAVSSGCIGGLDTCERSHAIREGLDIIESFYRFCSEKAEAGTLDGHVMEQAHHAMGKELTANREVRAYLALRECEAAFGPDHDCSADPEYYNDDYSDKDRLLIYAEGDAGALAEDLTHTVRKCAPGLVYGADGAIVESKCASMKEEKVPDPGHGAAVALQTDLKALRGIVWDDSPDSEQIRNALDLFKRIRSNGVTAYLAASCDAAEAFAKLMGPRRPGVDASDVSTRHAHGGGVPPAPEPHVPAAAESPERSGSARKAI